MPHTEHCGSAEARAYENYRMPNRLPEVYPQGFSPKETMKETDYALTAGARSGAWTLTASTCSCASRAG